MEEIIPIIAILAVFGTITAIVVGPNWLRARERRDMQETVRKAIDKGQELPSDLVDALSKDVAAKLPSRSRDLRRGVLWTATGLGIALFGYINEMAWRGAGWDTDDGRFFSTGTMAIAAIPVCIGVAFIILSFFNKNKD